MTLTFVLSLALLSPHAQELRLPPGCTLKTFSIASLEGWSSTNLQDTPEGREGCMFLRLRPDKTPAAVIEVESVDARLPVVRTADPFATLVGKITEGLKTHMNVAVGDLTFRNDDLKRAPRSPIDRAAMYAFDATVTGSKQPHEVVIVLARSPGLFFTVFAVTPSEKADAQVRAATQDAIRTLLNSLSPNRK
jgi:hypothetical protein